MMKLKIWLARYQTFWFLYLNYLSLRTSRWSWKRAGEAMKDYREQMEMIEAMKEFQSHINDKPFNSTN